MSIEDNKAALRRYNEEVWNQGQVAVLDELCAPEFIIHVPPTPDGFIVGLKQWVTMAHSAFSDFHITIEDMIAEGEQVVVRWTMNGTHTGDFMNPLTMMSIPPTGKHVTMRGMYIARFAGGKFVECWHYQDNLGLLQQLGLLPMPQTVS